MANEETLAKVDLFSQLSRKDLARLGRAAVALWRGRPDRLDEHAPPPEPPVGYATIPGEIDASQYDPARFQRIPEEERALPARDTLMAAFNDWHAAG